MAESIIITCRSKRKRASVHQPSFPVFTCGRPLLLTELTSSSLTHHLATTVQPRLQLSATTRHRHRDLRGASLIWSCQTTARYVTYIQAQAQATDATTRIIIPSPHSR